MPTPGKVLIGLILLLAPVWVILVSAVAELNKSGGQLVSGLQQQVETLEKQVSDTRRQIVSLKDKISLTQAAMDQELAVLRARQAGRQRARTETVEIAARVKYQVASTQEAVKQAEATRDLRAKEKTDEIAAKEAAEKEVEKLKTDHATYVEELDKLRSEFKATVEANRKLVDRLKPPTRSS